MSRLPPSEEPRPRIIEPRKRGFTHRPIVTLIDGLLVSEDGELIASPTMFAASMPSHIWMVDDPVTLLAVMLDTFSHVQDFNYQIVTSEDATDGPRFVNSRLTRFGFRCRCDEDHRDGCPWRKKNGMHLVWTPSYLSPNPAKLLAVHAHASYLALATDIRAWCAEQNLPLTTTLAGLANGLLRDARFWPEARGRVPRATNENVRKYLPGVYAELHGDTFKQYTAISLDQRTAYHVVATEVPAPDPTSLFARGYFNEPETSPLWAIPGDELFERTIRQPGLVFAQVQVHHARRHQFRPPAVTKPGRYRVAIWTNEIDYITSQGVTIEGLTAAWTANLADEGLPRYGEFAQAELARASEYRKRWLKPTLHALYGLFGVRPRRLKIGHLRGEGKDRTVARLGFAHEFPVANADLGTVTAPTANVATLGVLQSEIRRRSLELARDLSERGMTVLHIHADGVHVEGDSPPLVPANWKIEGLTRLHYIDRSSWVAAERDCLPGRDERMRAEIRRRQALSPIKRDQ